MNRTLDAETTITQFTESTRATSRCMTNRRRIQPIASPVNRASGTPTGRGRETLVPEPFVLSEGKLQLDRDTLYEEFRPLVQRLIRKYGDSPELRQDLRGEIYCLFCGLVDAYDPERGVPLKPYIVHQLTASVYTYARKHWRQERREVRLEFREDVTVPGMPEATDPIDQWNQDITMAQMQEFLAVAVAKLPLRQRQVVIWRYFEYRSFEDIAQVLGVQVATTRSILRHGLNNIRRSFEKADLRLEA